MDTIVNPWVRTWMKPREVIKEALIHSERKQEWLLIILFGLMLGLEQASLRSAGDTMTFPVILILSLVMSPLIGAIAWYLLSGIAFWTGKWFGGTASWEETRTAVSWASIPFTMKLVIWIPQLALFGEEMFTSQMPSLEGNPLMFVLYFLLAFVDLTVTIWFLVVLCKAVGVAHEFSAWRGFLSLIVGYLIVLLPFVLLAVLFRLG